MSALADGRVPETSDVLQALFLTTVAGLSTGLGGVIVVLAGQPSLALMGHMLSFSAGVMTFISFMDLLVEAVNQIGFFDSHFWFFLGMAFFALVTHLIPEPDLAATVVENSTDPTSQSSSTLDDLSDFGADFTGERRGSLSPHDALMTGGTASLLMRPGLGQRRPAVDGDDEMRLDLSPPPRGTNRPPSSSARSNVVIDTDGLVDDEYSLSKGKRSGPGRSAAASGGALTDPALFKVALYTAAGISLHNLPEGIAVFLACLQGLDVGIPLVVAIAAHNIPEGMAVAAPILGATGSRAQALKWSFLSGACEPVAAMLVGVLFSQYLTDYVVQAGLGAVAGIMVFMSVRELLPTSLKYISPSEATGSYILGMVVIFLSVHWMHLMMYFHAKHYVCKWLFECGIRIIGPLFVLLGLTLMSAIAYVHFGALYPMLTPAPADGGSALLYYLHGAWSVWLVFNFTWNYLMCIFTSPGISPDIIENETNRAELHKLRTQPVPERGRGFSSYCKTCRKPKPERAHHCHICGECVLRMDHHCPWVNNCVGHYNHRFFVLFLFYLGVSTLWVVFCAWKPFFSRDPIPLHWGGVNARGTLVFTFVICASVSVALGLMFLWHLYLAMSSQTTIEFYFNRWNAREAYKAGQPWRQPYSEGYRKNFQQFFNARGSLYWLTWAWPSLKGSMGDGVSWKNSPSASNRGIYDFV